MIINHLYRFGKHNEKEDEKEGRADGRGREIGRKKAVVIP